MIRHQTIARRAYPEPALTRGEVMAARSSLPGRRADQHGWALRQVALRIDDPFILQTLAGFSPPELDVLYAQEVAALTTV